MFYLLILKVFVVCRRGNDSQFVVGELLKHQADRLTSQQQSEQQCSKIECSIKDLIGGLQEWSSVVDKTFPKY
jgi:rhodanese-related sulfurtransferase